MCTPAGSWLSPDGRGWVLVTRITRHPALWGLALVGAGTVAASGLAIDAAMALGIGAMAVVGGAHQDRKKARSGELTPQFEAASSHLPFWALVSGRQQMGTTAGELAWLNAGLALAVAAALALRRGAVARRAVNKV